MKRRSLLGAALSSWFVAPSKLYAAGKPIFLGYDQEELDKAYDQSFWAPQMEQLEADDGTMSTAVRKATLPVTKQYGPTNADLIDVFTPASGRGAPRTCCGACTTGSACRPSATRCPANTR